MARQLRPALVLLLLFTLVTGLVYPFSVLGIGQLLMPARANGSLVRNGATIVGSKLIGQNFTGPGYFHGRPSAAGTGYDATQSTGSNLGPASRSLIDRTRAAVARARGDGVVGPIPADLLTASGSGLDPDLSPDAAIAQVARVARARGIASGRVRAIVDRGIDRPMVSILGDPRVNVLELNRQLDRIAPQRRR